MAENLKKAINLLNTFEEHIGTPKDVCRELPIATKYLIKTVHYHNHEKINEYKELLKWVTINYQKYMLKYRKIR